MGAESFYALGQRWGLRLVLALGLCAAVSMPAQAQDEGSERWAHEKGDALIPTCRFAGGWCGYVDRAGNTVIAPQFEFAKRFVDGRAVVGKDGKHGAIDETGKLVIPAIYDGIGSFERGMAVVLVGDRLGVINQNGKWVVPAKHGMILQISADRFLVAEPPYNTSHKNYFLNLNPLSITLHDKKWGIVARGGAWVVKPKFAQVSRFSDDLNGLFWASDSDRTGAQWQLMCADGTPVNDNLFEYVQSIQRGQDRAIVARGREGSRLWGAVNSKGEIVIELKFDHLRAFSDGWALYRLAGREGRIDKDGNILSDKDIQPSILNPDAKISATVDGEPLYTDETGTKLLGSEHPRCPDGRHLSFENGQWKIMTANKRPAPNIAFQWVSLKCSSHSVVQRDGKWGFITVNGKLLANRYFDYAHEFHDGIAAVIDNKLTAVIDERGNYLLGPLKLERRLGTSGAGGAVIELGARHEYKRLDKALVAELARDPEALTRPLTPSLPMSEGLAGMLDAKSGKWGFVDVFGRYVIKPRFDAVDSFRNGTAWAAFPDRRQWCQIDKTSQIRSPESCKCHQPLIIIEHYRRPEGADCYDDGLRIVRKSMW